MVLSNLIFGLVLCQLLVKYKVPSHLMNNLECERLKASEEKVEYLCDCDNNLTMPSDESMSPDSLKDLFRENTKFFLVNWD